MKNILTISKRETTRLRSRFRGRSRIVILLIVGLALAISYLIYQQGFVLSKDFYTVGVSSDGPTLSDKRFKVITIDSMTGHIMLNEKSIDIYLDGNEVLYRNDERSQYAAGALKQFLEKRELTRISNQYDIDKAFPLRIKINYLEAPESSIDTGTGVPLWDITEAEETATESATAPGPSSTSSTDTVVVEQLDEFKNDSGLPKFKAEFVSDEEIIIPSLMNPPIPLAQVIIAFFYVVPIFFISSFVEEKMDRKLNILLSTPVTPFQIIMGKMLPYIGYAVIGITAITLSLKGNVLLALAIFIPITLFILSIYLMVALLYRTFKDQTFFSLLAVTVITVYLVFPAMFSGISDLSSISPLNLAIQMYKGESFGLAEYLLSTTPMYLVFMLAMFIGVRVFNEEYLMSFRPLHVKLGDALYLAINKNHRYISTFFLTLLLIPPVFMIQLASIVLAFNLPMPFALIALVVVSVIVEETAKSSTIAVLLQNKLIKSLKSVVALSFIAVLGFFVGEKALFYIALNVISESTFTMAIFNTGLSVIPLIAHFVFTSIVCLIMARFGTKYYPIAVMAGSVVHVLYNLYIIGVIL